MQFENTHIPMPLLEAIMSLNRLARLALRGPCGNGVLLVQQSSKLTFTTMPLLAFAQMRSLKQLDLSYTTIEYEQVLYPPSNNAWVKFVAWWVTKILPHRMITILNSSYRRLCRITIWPSQSHPQDEAFVHAFERRQDMENHSSKWLEYLEVPFFILNRQPFVQAADLIAKILATQVTTDSAVRLEELFVKGCNISTESVQHLRQVFPSVLMNTAGLLQLNGSSASWEDKLDA